MLLSALTSSFIFPSIIFIHPSAFWDFCVPYLLVGTLYPELVGIYSPPFNTCKGVYYHKYPFQSNPTQYQYHLDGFSDTTSNCSTSWKSVRFYWTRTWITWADSVGIYRVKMYVSSTNMNDTSEIWISEYNVGRYLSFTCCFMNLIIILICSRQ